MRSEMMFGATAVIVERIKINFHFILCTLHYMNF